MFNFSVVMVLRRLQIITYNKVAFTLQSVLIVRVRVVPRRTVVCDID